MRDYKTAWTADERLLDSVQMRGQTLLLIAHAEPFSARPPRSSAARSSTSDPARPSPPRVDLGSIDADVLDDWRAEIDAPSPPSPSAAQTAAAPPTRPRCAGCVYRRVCDAVDPDAAEDVADCPTPGRAPAVADALEPILREATADQPMEVDGRIVGWHPQGKREPAPGRWTKAGRALRLRRRAPSGPPHPSSRRS